MECNRSLIGIEGKPTLDKQTSDLQNKSVDNDIHFSKIIT